MVGCASYSGTVVVRLVELFVFLKNSGSVGFFLLASCVGVKGVGTPFYGHIPP
jgi:hypothetical protein